jgi:hypothetical protein
LPQSPEKSFDVGQFAVGLSDLPVSCVFLEHWAIGFPEVAEAFSLAVFLWNPAPEPKEGRRVPPTTALCPSQNQAGFSDSSEEARRKAAPQMK